MPRASEGVSVPELSLANPRGATKLGQLARGNAAAEEGVQARAASVKEWQGGLATEEVNSRHPRGHRVLVGVGTLSGGHDRKRFVRGASQLCGVRGGSEGEQGRCPYKDGVAWP